RDPEGNEAGDPEHHRLKREGQHVVERLVERYEDEPQIDKAHDQREDRDESGGDSARHGAADDQLREGGKSAPVSDDEASEHEERAERRIAEGQEPDDDRPAVEHRQDADHGKRNAGSAELEAGEDDEPPGARASLFNPARGDDFKRHARSPSSSALAGERFAEKALRTEHQHHHEQREGDEIAQLIWCWNSEPVKEE